MKDSQELDSDDNVIDTKDLRTPESIALSKAIEGLEDELMKVKDRVTILERSRQLQLRGRNRNQIGKSNQ
jgi:hypothetical protein